MNSDSPSILRHGYDLESRRNIIRFIFNDPLEEYDPQGIEMKIAEMERRAVEKSGEYEILAKLKTPLEVLREQSREGIELIDCNV